MSSSYTCNACGVVFQTSPDQHEHMRSEWHRYNLKRRVADLPSISEEAFNTKVSSIQLREEAAAAQLKEKQRGRKGGKAESDVQKTVTKKEQRRREKEAIAEKRRLLLEQVRGSIQRSAGAENKSEETSEDNVIEPATEETVEAVSEATTEDAQDKDVELTAEQLMDLKIANYQKIPENTCLFSGKSFNTFDDCLTHMFKTYGFYIPEQKYLVDKHGLVAYLAEKIVLGNVCLCCNYQGRSLEAVRAHMISKRHCRIPYETNNEKLEISEFYDFRSTYDDSAAPPPAKIVRASEVDTADTDDWEDVSGSEEEEDDDDEEEAPQDLLYDTGYELHLPSGAVLGHRSLMRYYRQSVLPERVLSEGQGTVVAAETRRMATKTFDKKELALKKRTWKRQIKANDINDRRAAKFINNQPHYRDQLLQ